MTRRAWLTWLVPLLLVLAALLLFVLLDDGGAAGNFAYDVD